MKKHFMQLFNALVICGLLSSAAFAEEYSRMTWTTTNTQTLAKWKATNILSISCGKGRIEISLETGNAKFINCNPDDASRHLWEGLKKYFDQSLVGCTESR